jgi:hypothetical protein
VRIGKTLEAARTTYRSGVDGSVVAKDVRELAGGQDSVRPAERAYRTGQLELTGPLEDLQHPVVFDDLIDRLYTHNWVVYAKPPFAGPEKVLEYLARYTHRVAISNERLICLEDDEVVFRYKDYARGGAWRTRRLEAEEFIRRFLQHVLPDHFVRIRYFGMLANRHRREQLERARHCLLASSPPPAAPPGESREEMLYRLTGEDPRRCPVCGQGRLRRERELARDRSGRVAARAPP